MKKKNINIMTNTEIFLLIFGIISFLLLIIILMIYMTNYNNKNQTEQISDLEKQLRELEKKYGTRSNFVNINGIEYPLNYFRNNSFLLKKYLPYHKKNTKYRRR